MFILDVWICFALNFNAYGRLILSLNFIWIFVLGKDIRFDEVDDFQWDLIKLY